MNDMPEALAQKISLQNQMQFANEDILNKNAQISIELQELFDSSMRAMSEFQKKTSVLNSSARREIDILLTDETKYLKLVSEALDQRGEILSIYTKKIIAKGKKRLILPDLQ